MSDIVTVNAANLERDLGLVKNGVKVSNGVPDIVVSRDDAPDAEEIKTVEGPQDEVFTIGSALRSVPRQISQISQESARRAKKVRKMDVLGLVLRAKIQVWCWVKNPWL